MTRRILFVTMLLLHIIACYSKITCPDDLIQALSDLNESYAGYTTIIPVDDQAKTMNVSVDMDIFSITEFNQAAGFLDVSGYLTITWTEMIYSLSQRYTAPNVSAVVLASSLWVPPLVLMNSVDDVSQIGDTSSKVRIQLTTGECRWEQRVAVKASCTANVRYYPFDRQDCIVKFSTWVYTADELSLSVSSTSVGTQSYEDNVEWTLLKTSASSSILNDKSYVEFAISIQRKSMYFMINLLLPIFALSILNIFVFILPAESGERIGFSVTCFLAYVVFLGTVTSDLPKSSSPLSMISYYLSIMVIFSAATTIVVMITLRIYHKPENEPVPRWLKGLANCLQCLCCNSSVGPSIRESDFDEDEDLPPQKAAYNVLKIKMFEDLKKERPRDEITWNSVGRVVDKFCLVAFLVAEIVFTTSYMLPIILNNGTSS